ncbi:MAG: ribonuclease III [Pseudomonadota bacterium]|nr:ribonuclease III [Pseudomonadota bacterium]
MTIGSDIENKIGYTFNNKEFLLTALTHKSVSRKNNERLEFLGDAILSSIITSKIFQKLSDKNEGILSRMRSHLINKEKLIQVAEKLDIKKDIKLSNNENKRSTGAGNAIMADTLEALIGAIFLDSNWETCNKVVSSWYEQELSNTNMLNQDKDAKTKLQEYMQALSRPIPEYEVLKTEGLEHEQVFFVNCKVKGIRLKSSGSGKTIKKAEQEAAKKFLIRLQEKEKI